MDKFKFFTILKKIQGYAFETEGYHITANTAADGNDIICERDKRGGEKSQYLIDPGRFQINPARDAEYSFLLYTEREHRLRKFALLSAFVQGAISHQGEFDESFTNYQKNNLKLLFGTYAFVDEENDRLHYLLGPSRNNIKQNFHYKTYYNIENYRGTPELMELDEKISKFLFSINQESREKDINSVNDIDFYKIVNNKDYECKMNPVIESAKNIVYVSSGEADHCILQWIFLERSNKEPYIGDETLFEIDMERIYYPYRKIFAENGFTIPYANRNANSASTWLKEWGFTSSDSDKPTERLLAAIEWFYFL